MTIASTLGAALAGRDKCLGRTILFTGDGSMCVIRPSCLILLEYFMWQATDCARDFNYDPSQLDANHLRAE
jgi:hypothetical protein